MTRTVFRANPVIAAVLRRGLWIALLPALALGCNDEAEPAPRFQLVFEGLQSALISVSGSSARDVWTVGSRDEAGRPLVMQYDGSRWRRHDVEVDADLWWVFVVREGLVFIGGTGGTVLRYEDGRFEQLDTPGSSTVYGIWGTSEDDLWAVGGEPDVAPGFVWHWDGVRFSDQSDALPFDSAAERPALFKVWGRMRRDVMIVGMDGTALHFDGERFARADAGTDRRLFTVHGSQSGEPGFVAVGGFGDGVITERAGTRWHAATPDPAPAMLFGVHMDAPGHGFAVGYEGSVLERRDGAWNLLDTGLELFNPFHAVWVDPDGGFWAVGGDVLSPTPFDGMLVHRGAEISDAFPR